MLDIEDTILKLVVEDKVIIKFQHLPVVEQIRLTLWHEATSTRIRCDIKVNDFSAGLCQFLGKVREAMGKEVHGKGIILP